MLSKITNFAKVAFLAASMSTPTHAKEIVVTLPKTPFSTVKPQMAVDCDALNDTLNKRGEQTFKTWTLLESLVHGWPGDMYLDKKYRDEQINNRLNDVYRAKQRPIAKKGLMKTFLEFDAMAIAQKPRYLREKLAGHDITSQKINSFIRECS
jgi:hypothetical protein